MLTQKKDERGKNSQTPKLKISEIQDLQLKVIGLTNQNALIGKKVEKLLRQNSHLWRTVFMPSKELYPLRDMEDGEWSADTLYVFVREGKESELEQLVKEKFDADAINWIDSNQTLELLGYWKKDSIYNPKMILSVWWN